MGCQSRRWPASGPRGASRSPRAPALAVPEALTAEAGFQGLQAGCLTDCAGQIAGAWQSERWDAGVQRSRWAWRIHQSPLQGLSGHPMSTERNFLLVLMCVPPGPPKIPRERTAAHSLPRAEKLKVTSQYLTHDAKRVGISPCLSWPPCVPCCPSSPGGGA